MEENEDLMEQSQAVQSDFLDDKSDSITENLAEQNDAEKVEAERGVPTKKFKSVEDLEKAYESLQAEFTRKCQRLSELEKKDKTADVFPKIERNLDEEFKLFLLDNQEAFSYADEIKKRVENDERLKYESSPFEKVWADILLKKFSDPNRAKDEFVKNLILKDNDLKTMVVEDYMKDLKEAKAPFVFSASEGERVTKPASPKPDSFEQAKQVVLDLLS